MNKQIAIFFNTSRFTDQSDNFVPRLATHTEDNQKGSFYKIEGHRSTDERGESFTKEEDGRNVCRHDGRVKAWFA